jgi:hypothetical protein
MSLDDISTEDLLAKLTPAARRRYLDTMLGQDFAAFVRKVCFSRIGTLTP